MKLKTILFWFEITIFSLNINMKLQFFLNVENKIVVVQFANEILIINNEITIKIFIHDEFESKTLWNYKYIENNNQLNFIKTIYSNFMITICKILTLSKSWQRFFLTIAEAVREQILIVWQWYHVLKSTWWDIMKHNEAFVIVA